MHFFAPRKEYFKMFLYELFKEQRKLYNFTQEELAIKLNVSRQTISKWETNVTIPDANNIVEISKLFNITTDELLDYRVETVKKKKQFIVDMVVLFFGIIGFIIFAIFTTVSGRTFIFMFFTSSFI